MTRKKGLFNNPFTFLIIDVIIFLHRFYSFTNDYVVFTVFDTLTAFSITKMTDVPLNGMTEDRVAAALQQVQMLLHHVRLERGQLCGAVAAEITRIRDSLVPGVDVKFEVAGGGGGVVTVHTWIPDLQVCSVLQETYIYYANLG